MVRIRAEFLSTAIVLISVAQLGCKSSSINDGLTMSIAIASPNFRQGEDIPKQFACDGANSSPALSWPKPPPGTKSLALIVTDQDSLFGSFVHWLVYNIPPNATSFPAGVPKNPQLADARSKD